MDGRKPMSEDLEDEDDSSSEGSSTTSDVDSDSTTSSEEDVEVAFLLVDEEHKENDVMALVNDDEEEHTGPYEVIEELMQPKMDVAGKQGLIMKMLSSDLSVMERNEYLEMLSGFPNLFITSYEEIRGFKGDSLRIELKDGMKPVRQRLRRMGQEQMQALREEVDKLLKADFIYPVDTT